LTSIIGRYLSRRVLAYFALMLIVLAALALTLDLMEEADRVLASERSGLSGLLLYCALRLPDIGAQMLPIAALLGTLLVLGQLLRHSELVALWGSGVSPAGMMLSLLPVVVLLAGLHLANNDITVPASRLELRDWGVGDARKTGLFVGDNSFTWLRSGPDIVRTPPRLDASGALTDVSVFRRDAEGRLIERIDARRAEPRNNGWMFYGVTRNLIEPAVTQREDSTFWSGRIEVAALPLIASDMRELRTSDLLHLIEHDGFGQRPADRYRTWLQARIASAFLPGLMIYLVVSLGQRFRRGGGFGTLMLTSLSIGFGFFALDGVCLTMGESGLLPPWFAAWGPKLALACLIGTFVLTREA
jgi:lipopolysaccharide export system permease protein